ncbi:MAG: hypothetical protein ACR2GN_06235 [Bacteroidia bacterium]
MAELAKDETQKEAASTAIILAAFSNTIVKFFIAFLAESLLLSKKVAISYGSILLGGFILLLLRLMF